MGRILVLIMQFAGHCLSYGDACLFPQCGTLSRDVQDENSKLRYSPGLGAWLQMTGTNA